LESLQGFFLHFPKALSSLVKLRLERRVLVYVCLSQLFFPLGKSNLTIFSSESAMAFADVLILKGFPIVASKVL